MKQHSRLGFSWHLPSTSCAALLFLLTCPATHALDYVSKTPKAAPRSKQAPTPPSKAPSLKQQLRLSGPLKTTELKNSPTSSTPLTLRGSISGKVVYTFTRRKGLKRSFLSVNTFSAGIEPYVSSTYEASGIDVSSSKEELTSPLISPNGRYVAFKLESPWILVDSYYIYVLDTYNGEVVKAYGKPLSYPNFRWSPDSKFLAFIENGDYQGETSVVGDDYIGPLTLCVCDWRTGKRRVVTKNDTIGRFMWSVSGDLLYGELPLQDQKRVISQAGGNSQGATSTSKTAFTPRPKVYSYSVSTDSSKILIDDAYQPVPSPDGNRVVFYGSEFPIKPVSLFGDWRYESHGAALCVSNVDGTNRVALDIEPGLYSYIEWLPDNRHFITIQTTAEGSESQAQIKEWDVESKKFRVISVLKSKDYKKFPVLPLFPTFRPLGVSPDGKSLMVLIVQATGKDVNSSRLDISDLLRSIDIESGKVSDIAQVSNDGGVDWRFGEQTPMPIETPLIK